jgi:hypothetical protein
MAEVPAVTNASLVIALPYAAACYSSLQSLPEQPLLALCPQPCQIAVNVKPPLARCAALRMVGQVCNGFYRCGVRQPVPYNRQPERNARVPDAMAG